MPRVVSLYLPTFPTDRIRRTSGLGRSKQAERGAPGPAPSLDGPLVTLVRDGSRRILGAVDATAQGIGLRPGQPVAQAQASVPGLQVVEAAPHADRDALLRLAAWCLRYSPVVQADPPDGIFLDIEGAAHLHGGEAALLADVTGRLRRAGYAAQAAVADTPGAAWALARHGENRRAPPGGGAALLVSLPVQALRLTNEVSRDLHLLGIESIGQLGAFPRAQLTRRFGPGLLELYDRALGHALEPLTPLVPRTVPCARRCFAEPLGHVETLEAAVGRLAPQLCRELERRAQGLRQLDAVFRRVDGRPIGIRIGTAAPSRDPGHLAKLVSQRLPEIDPGFGIDEIALWASRVEGLQERQTAQALEGWEAAAPDQAALGPLVDKLAVRLGAERVYRAAPVESRHPERSVQRVPALAPARGDTWPADLPRPSRLIEPPEPVLATALLPDYPPTAFTWRRVRYAVRAADGPERVTGEWWRSDEEVASLRDYYRVEDDKGRRFWLFRNAPGPDGTKWWLHGRFA